MLIGIASRAGSATTVSTARPNTLLVLCLLSAVSIRVCLRRRLLREEVAQVALGLVVTARSSRMRVQVRRGLVRRGTRLVTVDLLLALE